MSEFELGKTVPNLILPTATGEEYNFEEQRKQKEDWYLIIFFRGSWCPACMSELDALEEGKDYFNKKDIHIITISTDNLNALTDMTKEHKFSFTVLSDEQHQAIKDYQVHYHKENAPYEDHGAHGEPAYFLVDENGRLLYQQRQTSPFGRPSVTELRKITTYIHKNMK
ncbi:peroxiredoxin family protein [Paraliobacillus zengyii]|uniref:peroxiredoxin family protein n=1 Tax=Paraliobacillus zengyii TaxID=2213194 RepID=UPI000DD45942|nr:peroxiredoxin family protein [Paraliobacillus zengyii]